MGSSLLLKHIVWEILEEDILSQMLVRQVLEPIAYDYTLVLEADYGRHHEEFDIAEELKRDQGKKSKTKEIAAQFGGLFSITQERLIKMVWRKTNNVQHLQKILKRIYAGKWKSALEEPLQGCYRQDGHVD